MYRADIQNRVEWVIHRTFTFSNLYNLHNFHTFIRIHLLKSCKWQSAHPVRKPHGVDVQMFWLVQNNPYETVLWINVNEWTLESHSFIFRSLFAKVANLLKFPHSPKLERLPTPYHVIAKANKIEKQKGELQVAQEKADKKKKNQCIPIVVVNWTIPHVNWKITRVT